MIVVILAVTKSYDGFCVAGMNEDGEWIRPISNNSPGRFWTKQELTINGQFTKTGDIWEIEGHPPNAYEYFNHREDFILTSRIVQQRYTDQRFETFLDQQCEGEQDLQNVFAANRRSLCLVKADGFTHYTTNFDGKHRARMIFTSNELDLVNPHTNNGNIIVKDCKWEGVLLRSTTIPERYRKIYICIGLATPILKEGVRVEYPQVVGLHTFPVVPHLASYPD